MEKYHIQKNTVQEILVIPLFGRLICSERFPHLFSDPEAKRICDSLNICVSHGMRDTVSTHIHTLNRKLLFSGSCPAYCGLAAGRNAFLNKKRSTTMVKKMFSPETDGFYGCWYPNPSGPDTALILMLGDDSTDLMAVSGVRWIHKLGHSALAMSPAKKDYGHHN